MKRHLKTCKTLQKGPTVRLNNKQKEIVREAILQEAQRIDQTLEALVVCTNHIYLATRPCRESIENIVNRYKHAATRALRRHGLSGRIWTIGFDKRFCFTEADLAKRIAYIQNH